MDEELDPNKIAAEIVQQNLEKICAIPKRLIKATTDNVRLYLNNTYKEYIKTIFEKHSRIKSFFITNEPTYLYEFYVHLDLKYGKKIVENPGINNIIEISKFNIITGSAGSGKSIFMRHLLINSIIDKGKIPIFVELRQLNSNKIALIRLIEQVLFSNKFRFDMEYISKALENGHFILFLDGFDEVNLDRRYSLIDEITSLADNYTENCIIISSRKDNILDGLRGFTNLEILPLTLNKAQELIEKLPFNDEIKTKFLTDLGKHLFDTHKSFLSNPLLLSIMLLTYGRGAHIPNKLNLFYNQAYEALFQHHDALKGAYQRQRFTKLDIQEFAKVFSLFCLMSYDKTESQFTRLQAIEYLKYSKIVTNLEFQSEDFLKDALQSVCLLVEDGLLITFTHRSFQEYFTARFIAEAKPSVQQDLINRYYKNVITDNVFKILYEMNPDLIENYYIFPVIEKMKKVIDEQGEIIIEKYIEYLKENFHSFWFKNGELHSILGTAIGAKSEGLIHFLINNFHNLVPWEFRTRKTVKIHSKGELEIQTKDITREDPIVHYLLYSNYASFSQLKYIVKIGKKLKEQRINSDSSLTEILKLNH